jgi:hypothetical protein
VTKRVTATADNSKIMGRDMDENRVKHLELIQNVVTRLAGNSFFMKGWSITLIAGLFALAAKDANQSYVAIAILPVVCFWGLDAYYLWQERLFRKLYDEARKPETGVELFSMDTRPVAKCVSGWCCTLFRPVVLFFHGPVLAAVIVILVFVSKAEGWTCPFTHAAK